MFSILVLMIFYIALELDPKMRNTIAAGVLWVTFAFAGTLGLNRSMAIEKDLGCRIQHHLLFSRPWVH